jgi:hypothetical protein
MEVHTSSGQKKEKKKAEKEGGRPSSSGSGRLQSIASLAPSASLELESDGPSEELLNLSKQHLSNGDFRSGMYSLMHIVSSASVKRKYLFQASRPTKIYLDSRTETELPPYYERGVWAGGVSYVGADGKLPSVILSKSKLAEAKVLLAGLLVSQEKYDHAEELYQVFMLYNFEQMMPNVFCERERVV